MDPVLEPSFYQNLKISILQMIPLSKDAIHIYIGLIVFLISVHFLKRRFGLAYALLPPLVVSLAMEAWDLRDDYVYKGELAWENSLHDLFNTNTVPLIFYLYLRFFHRNAEG
jgi:hypothetical protein